MANFTFEQSPKHRSAKRGRVGAQPIDGQAALKNSLQISDNSSRRVGIDHANKQIVVLMEHLPGIFHGFVVEWKELELRAQRVLQRLGLVTSRGRILKAKR